jgi:hypothetical protein
LSRRRIVSLRAEDRNWLIIAILAMFIATELVAHCKTPTVEAHWHHSTCAGYKRIRSSATVFYSFPRLISALNGISGISRPGRSAATSPPPSGFARSLALKSTLSRIALSALSSVHERLTFPARIGGFSLLRETPGLTCDLRPVIFHDSQGPRSAKAPKRLSIWTIFATLAATFPQPYRLP